MNEKVAVLLSVFNGEKYLRKQLESIATQSRKADISLYIRDDGSSDGSGEIVEAFKDANPEINVVIVSDGENLGPAKSFWRMLRLAEGFDFYAFSDQDDVWLENKLEIAVDAMRRCGEDEPVLWCSDCSLIDENDNLLEHSMRKDQPIFTIPSQIVCGSIQGCCMVFNAAAREYVLRFPMNVLPMHDIAVMVYTLSFGKVLYEGRPLIRYRMHSGNSEYHRGGFRKRARQTLSRWLGSGKGLYSDFAKQVLRDNREVLTKENENALRKLIRYRESFRNRIMLIRDPAFTSADKRGLRSFRLRVLLGLF